jgi:hypothetical protein
MTILKEIPQEIIEMYGIEIKPSGTFISTKECTIGIPGKYTVEDAGQVIDIKIPNRGQITLFKTFKKILVIYFS